MVSLSSLIEFEGTYELLHKMDFASSCLRQTHRRKASRFINGNSRQTTEAKDTSVCKCFQMETGFSLHSLQFSFERVIEMEASEQSALEPFTPALLPSGADLQLQGGNTV